MSKKNTIAKNYIYNLIYKMLELIMPLITIPYVSRILGAEGIGIYNYTVSITTYFILLGSLGIGLYAQREIAYVQQDLEKRSKIFWEVLLIKIFTLSISMIIFYFTFVTQGEYSIYYKILILEIVANMLDISPFFQGMEEFKKIIRKNMIIKITSILCVFIFIKNPTDIDTYIFIYALSTLLGSLSLWLDLPKYITKVKIKSLELKKHLKIAFELFIPQIAIKIYTVLDKTMLGVLITDKTEVGYYGQTDKIIRTVLSIITSLNIVMIPRMANKFANGEDKNIRKNILTSFKFTFFLAMPMMLGLIAIAKDFMPWFLGEGFENSIYITYAMSPIILVIGLGNLIGNQYLLPISKQRQYTIAIVIGAITNVILNFILIPKFAAIGAAIATVIAEAVVTGIQFYYIRKDYDLKYVWNMSIKYIISSIIMAICVIVANILLLSNVSVLIRIIVDIIVGTTIYLLILVIMKDEFLKQILNKAYKIKYICNKINKKF